VEELTVVAVGDIGPRRADPASLFKGVGHGLAGDVVFGQMECVVSRMGTAAPNARLAMRTSPDVAGVLREAGFDVLSLAGNHAMDYGGAALVDSVAHLRAAGIATCGAGTDMGAARAPAVIERRGRSIAILAYNAILPHGYAAQGNRPGCAPLRVYTHYEPVEPDQPGTDPRIHTLADAADLDAMLADVADACSQADHVLVSMHWGIHFVRATLAQYQRVVGRALIDAGAAAVLGHHPHLLKAVEFHRGRPILHSMGNFAIEQPSAFMENLAGDEGFKAIRRLNTGWKPAEKYMNPDETRHTVIARLALAGQGLRLSLIPCRIDDDCVPQAANANAGDGAAVLAYLDAVTREAGVATRYRACPDGTIAVTPG